MKSFCVLGILMCIVHHIRGYQDFALVMARTEAEYKLVSPIVDANNPQHIIFHKHNFWKSQSYLKCPLQSLSNITVENRRALFTKQTIENKDVDLNDVQVCNNEVLPTVFKAAEEWELENGETFAAYHIGFQLSNEDFDTLVRYPNYMDLDEKYYIKPLIGIFKNMDSNRIMAVQYKVFEARKFFQPKYTSIEQYWSHSYFTDESYAFLKNQEQKFQELFSEENIPKFYNREANLYLEGVSLVNENDFMIETWKKNARSKVLLVPVWKKFLQTWRYIEEFITTFISKFPLATITTGLGNEINVVVDVNIVELAWGSAFIPEFYWKSIEIDNAGFFIIMHNDPFAESMNKICDEDFCEKEALWKIRPGFDSIKMGPVYCCEMNEVNIKSLGAGFLLEEKNRIPYIPYNQRQELMFPPNLVEESEKMDVDGSSETLGK